MAATVSGITQISALPNTGWTAAAVGNGTLAMPLANQSATKLDGSLFGQKIENAGTNLAIGDIYTAYRMYATATNGVDISADNAALQFHIQDTAGGITAMNDATDVIRVGIFTGGSTANWAEWNVQGRTIFRTGVYVPVICGHRTPDSTGGTLDYTDVTGIYVGFKSAVSGYQYGLSLAISQLVYWTGPVAFADTNTDATTPADYLAILNRFSGNTYHGEYVREAGSAIEFSFPIKNTARNFSTTADISFRTDNCAFTSVRDGFYSYEAEPISTGTQTYTATKFSSDATKALFDLTLDGSTGGGTINYTGASVASARNVVINGTLTTVDGTFSDPVGIDISQSDLDITITKSTNTTPIQWSADLTAGSSITTNRDIDILFAETDLTDIGLTLTASNTVAVNPTTGSGTYTLAGLTTTGTVTLDNDTANNTTVVLPAGTTNATVGPPTTGGGDIVVDAAAVVTVAVTVQDTTFTAISSSRVYLEAATGGPLPYRESVTLTRSGSTVTVTHTAHGRTTGDEIKIRGADQDEYNISSAITVTGTNSYTYTVSGTPTTPATGTITATSVILNGTTDGSGLISDASFTYTADQPVVGTARKSTGSPLYKAGLISGTITSSGLSATAILVGDE